MPKKQTSKTPNFDRIRPQTCLNGKFRKLHRLVNSAYMSKLKPYGLGGSMLSILFIIGKRKGVNPKAIAKQLVLDQSTMSRDLNRLIGKGWVKEERGEDARYKALYLTDEGYALLEEVVPIWEVLHERVQSVLGSYQVAQVDHLITAIQEQFQETDD